jgi:hypothetical protein
MNGAYDEDRQTPESYSHPRALEYSRYAQYSARARVRARTNPWGGTTFEAACASLDMPIYGGEDGIHGYKYVHIMPWEPIYRLECWLYKNEVKPTEQAKCQYHPHPAPWPTCGCGFYAVPNKLEPGIRRVVAEVELGGIIIEHEWGWRGEYQRILSLEVGPNFPFTPAEVRRDIPVELRVPSEWYQAREAQLAFDKWMEDYDHQF